LVQLFLTLTRSPAAGSARRHLPAREELSSVGDQCAVVGIDARPSVRGRHQLAQYRRYALGRDRQLQRREAVVAEGVLGAVDVRQPVGVQHDAAGFHGCVGSYGGGNDLALSAQAVAFRIDQPGMVLAQIEDAAEQDGEADRWRE
jgi:hypothetical protein